MIKDPNELLNDSAVDIAAHIVHRFGNAEENAFIDGTGPSSNPQTPPFMPTSIRNSFTPTTGNTTTDAQTVHVDYIYKLYYSLKSLYRRKASYATRRLSRGRCWSRKRTITTPGSRTSRSARWVNLRSIHHILTRDNVDEKDLKVLKHMDAMRQNLISAVNAHMNNLMAIRELFDLQFSEGDAMNIMWKYLDKRSATN